ncbi:MAG: hypothetical protein KKD39_08675, partial [Candidatus Altiarchaeota archaeon]|nr:hypothetical protein [Candidatus Altiarchaeota archaeon]
QRGLATGSQAEEGVSTGAEVVSVMASDGNSGHDLERFEVVMRIQAGSESMNFNNTVILLDTATTSQNLIYNGTLTSDREQDTGVTTGDYRVYYIKAGPDYEAGYLARGDVVKAKFRCLDCSSATADTGGIGENQRIRLKIVPRVGQAAIVEFTTPDVITDQRVTLWP